MARYDDEDMPEMATAREREPLIDRVAIIEKRLHHLEETAEATRDLLGGLAKTVSRELGI